jgi:hypothetical protein
MATAMRIAARRSGDVRVITVQDKGIEAWVDDQVSSLMM